MATPLQQQRGLARRTKRIQDQIRWFGDKVQSGIKIGMSARLRIAGQLLRDITVVNISRPVTKIKGIRSGRMQVVPSSRSRRGEYPKADTTRLMKDVYFEMRGKNRVIVGTTLGYGLLLETRMSRSFLRRTLNENRSTFRRILVAGTPSTARFPGEE